VTPDPDPLAAAALGLAVFGLPPGSKRAAPGWHDQCTADPAAIAARWRPGDNIGIGCRASGIAVLDLDRHAGKPDGVATFGQLLAAAGADWPATLTIATAGGGLHLYFTIPAAMTVCSANGAWPGIDVRGPGYRLGGYVAGPGSVVSGSAYTVAEAAPAAGLPGWLAAALTARQERRHANRRPGSADPGCSSGKTPRRPWRPQSADLGLLGIQV
jgi:Bifunctional DNA primase/polymerase, N-terminal